MDNNDDELGFPEDLIADLVELMIDTGDAATEDIAPVENPSISEAPDATS